MDMEQFPNYHPMIVHFPIVLLVLAVLMQLVSFGVKNKGFHYTILVFTVLGYASAYLAAAWRHPQIEREMVSAAAQLIYDEHQWYARWSVYLGGAGAVLKGVELYFRQRLFLVLLTALALTGAAVAVGISGHHDAELVHIHGIGPKGEFLKKIPANSSQAVVHTNPNAVENDTTPKSIKAMTVGKIGAVTVTIQYSSPKVRRRAIWGELVPFEKVWVTGANNATSVEFDGAVEVAGTVIPAGKYAFFTIPGKETWTLILNKNWEQHLADKYDLKDDVVRTEVKPEHNPHTERLQYFVEQPMGDAPDGGISIAWETLKIRMAVKVKF